MIDGQPRHVSDTCGTFVSAGAVECACQHAVGRRTQSVVAGAAVRAPSNLLVMDEPTNDLDADTLELLEEMVGNYAGRCCS